MRLFWRLARPQNPHLRRVNCGFSDFGNSQNSSPYTILWARGFEASEALLGLKIEKLLFNVC